MDLSTTATDRLLHAAMSGLAVRQRVISDNIANVDTPGFKASEVSFERALRRASGADQELRLMKVEHGLPEPGDESGGAQVTPLAQTTRRLDGNNVDIDQQMLELASTNTTFNALAQLELARLQALRTVINDGRR